MARGLFSIFASSSVEEVKYQTKNKEGGYYNANTNNENEKNNEVNAPYTRNDGNILQQTERIKSFLSAISFRAQEEKEEEEKKNEDEEKEETEIVSSCSSSCSSPASLDKTNAEEEKKLSEETKGKRGKDSDVTNGDEDLIQGLSALPSPMPPAKSTVCIQSLDIHIPLFTSGGKKGKNKKKENAITGIDCVNSATEDEKKDERKRRICNDLSELSKQCFGDDVVQIMRKAKKNSHNLLVLLSPPVSSLLPSDISCVSSSPPSCSDSSFLYEGVLLGYMLYRVRADTSSLEISQLAVRSDCRGMGYGAKILKEAIKIAKQNPNVHFVCLSSLKEAIRFYKKFGFRRDDSIKFNRPKNEDEMNKGKEKTAENEKLHENEDTRKTNKKEEKKGKENEVKKEESGGDKQEKEEIIEGQVYMELKVKNKNNNKKKARGGGGGGRKRA